MLSDLDREILSGHASLYCLDEAVALRSIAADVTCPRVSSSVCSLDARCPPPHHACRPAEPSRRRERAEPSRRRDHAAVELVAGHPRGEPSPRPARQLRGATSADHASHPSSTPRSRQVARVVEVAVGGTGAAGGAVNDADAVASAYHEAGHTVSLLAVGGSVEAVSLAETAAVLPPGAPAGHVALAGVVAECRYLRRVVPPVARGWPNEWQLDLASWRRHLRVDDEALARALWTDSLEAADRLVRTNWAAVVAIANTLVERGSLTGAEVGRLIDAERSRLRQARAAGLGHVGSWPQYSLAI